MEIRQEERAVIARGGKVMLKGYGTREQQLAAVEVDRISSILQRRLYMAGEQYERENVLRLAQMVCPPGQSVAMPDELPEHEKKLAYSTHIEECVDFLAAQLASQFQVSAKNPKVQQVIEDALLGSPDLAEGDEVEDVSITNLLREALTAGDVAVHIRWEAAGDDDDLDGYAWYELWESEDVEFRYSQRDRNQLDEVLLTQLLWEPDPAGGPDLVERKKVTRWFIYGGECVAAVKWDDLDEGPARPVGLPFIPWRLVRGMRKGLRAQRGQSAISDQAMRLADRYNSVEQTSYLIARYNSHGNLVVIGDSAQVLGTDKTISKDVADVLTFPTGTSAVSLTLPTDPQMIEHQRQVLLDSLYGTFGLTRLDQSTIQGLGQVSGYALEILNRKTEGTFSEVKRQVIRDLKALFSMTLDVTAYLSDQSDGEDDEILGYEWDPELTDEENEVRDWQARMDAMDRIDPGTLFPDRSIEIRLASGYIVDDVMVRDDFVAGLISRREALRQRGMGDDEIKKIEEEIEEEKKAASSSQETGISDEARAAAAAALAEARTADADTPKSDDTPTTTQQALAGNAQATGTTPNAQSTDQSTGTTRAGGTLASTQR